MKYLILTFLATAVAGLHKEFNHYLDQSHDHKNLIGSSYAAEMAIGMLSAGAGGDTAKELLKALNLSNKEDMEEQFEDLLALNPNTIEVNNYLLVSSEYKVLDSYKDQMAEHFEGTTDTLDTSNPKNVALKVNKWVKDRTHGRVRQLVSYIGPNVIAILINTLYFKGQWARKFNPELTETQDFHVSAKKTVPVQMMSMRGRFNTEMLPDLDARVIEVPFKQEGLVMLIYLPNNGRGLKDLEEKIQEPTRPKERQFVNLKLPKFRISTKTKLKPVLKLFGIEKVFLPTANLSGIVENSQTFYIDDIIQNAFIEISENGAEVVTITEGRTPSVEFIVNVPFAYVIRDANEVYFQGHVNEPEWD